LRDPMTFREVLAHLEERIVLQEVVDYVKHMAANLESAGKEISRLRRVVDDHSKTLSLPISDQMQAKAFELPSLDGLHRETRVRLEPQLYEIRMPVESKAWSPDHKDAFVKTTAEFVGMSAGKVFAKLIWPKQDQR